MGKKGPVPDAWEDDDWEAQVDRQDRLPEPEPAPAKPLTQRQRLAQHAEMNRKLWEEAQETNHFVEATSSVPLASTFKPQVKVLSRKPTGPVLARRDPVTGAMSNLSLGDDDDDDGQKNKAAQLTPEEIRARQQREREEKQRRYDEARAKIFGESNPSSGASSPGTVTPPRSDARSGAYQNQRGRGRGRGRGGQSGNRQQQQQQHQQQQASNYMYQNQQQAPPSPHQQQYQQFSGDTRRPGSGFEAASRELYDPNAVAKPGRRGGDSTPVSGRASPREQDQAQPAIRAPRGPDGSGRGGFGFARRGGQGGD